MYPFSCVLWAIFWSFSLVSLSLCVQSNYPISLNAGVMNQRLYISVASW